MEVACHYHWQDLSLDEARDIGWLFEKKERNNFWSQFTELYGGMGEGRVEWSALGAAVPSWLVMLVIVNLDNMLKLASTEAQVKLPPSAADGHCLECHHSPLSASTSSHQLPKAPNGCHQLPPAAAGCRRLPPDATKCSPTATDGHRLPPTCAARHRL